jgi:RNA polymerase sigma-70 factor (TIGR02960 family)
MTMTATPALATITTRSTAPAPPTSVHRPTVVDDPVVDAATAGDDAAFALLVERHRRELHRHCTRMLRSTERAEDVVQEALLRAWRARGTFSGRSTFRTWLYRIATNACLDEIRRARPQGAVHDDVGHDAGAVARGDAAGDAIAPVDAQPDAVVIARESVEAAFLAAIELLPPRQRAVLVLREVLRCSAAETALVLGTTVASANSALQRARATLDGPPPEREPTRVRTAALAPCERALLQRYVDAVGRDDAAAVVAAVCADLAAA